MTHPTQRDIARYLGMSQSSVSRALKGDARLLPETRAKVLQASKELGYKPNPAVGALSQYRWNKAHPPKGLTLAFITNKPTTARTGFDELLAAATEAGYTLDVIELKPGLSPRFLLRILHARGISGVFFFLDDSTEVPACVEAVSERYPAVSWGCIPKLQCACVIRDAYHRVADCCLAMSRADYKKALIILPGDIHHPNSWMQEMHAAWLLHRRGHPGWEDAWFVTYQEHDWDALADRLRMRKPDAIIVANEDILIEIEKRGITPGHDLPFACMDVKEGRTYTGIRSTFPLVAAHCVVLLDSMIARRTTGKDNAWIHVEVRGDWIDGDSM